MLIFSDLAAIFVLNIVRHLILQFPSIYLIDTKLSIG